jgi:hypothetical protein
MVKPVPRNILALNHGMFSTFQEQYALLTVNFTAAAYHLPLTPEQGKNLAYELSRLWMMGYNALAVDVFSEQAGEIKSSLVSASKMAESVGIDARQAICLELANSVARDVMQISLREIPAGFRAKRLHDVIVSAVGRDGFTRIRVQEHSQGMGVQIALNRGYLSDAIRGQINDELIARGVMPILIPDLSAPEIP